MEVLSQEYIAFIDRYLENSDVVYADIRMEMVDHVASEIEFKIKEGDKRSFYELFKEYMILNKSKLLEQKRAIIFRLSKKLAFQTLVKITKINYIICLMVLTGLYMLMMKTIGIQSSVWIHLGLCIMLLMGGIISYEVYRNKYKIARFSGMERLGFIVVILIQLIFFTRNISGLYSDSQQLMYAVVFSFQLTLSVAVIDLGRQQLKIYINRFQKS